MLSCLAAQRRSEAVAFSLGPSLLGFAPCHNQPTASPGVGRLHCPQAGAGAEPGEAVEWVPQQRLLEADEGEKVKKCEVGTNIL